MVAPLSLALAAVQSLAAVAFLVLAGWVYSRSGHFPLSMQRDLARLVVQLLAPCLLFVSIAHTISLEEFILWWPIPALFIANTSIGAGLSFVISKYLGIPRGRMRFIMSAVMMSNTNSLPVGIMHSLARDPGSRSVLDPHSKHSSEHVARRGIAFVLFYSLFSNILRWTVCYQLLAKSPQDAATPVLTANDSRDTPSIVETASEDTAVDQETLFPGDAIVAGVPDSDRNTFAARCRRRSQVFTSSEDLQDFFKQRTPIGPDSDERSPLLPPPVSSGDFVNSISPPSPREIQDNISKTRWANFKETIKDIMNPPLYAALFAIVVGIIPPLKALFFGPDTTIDAPLEEMITDPLYSLGEASVPIIILTLGGQLGSMQAVAEGPSEEGVVKDAVVVMVIRMMLMPLAVGGFLWTAGDFIPLGHDRTFLIAMMLLSACPTALNIMNMSQAQRNHENRTARLLSYSYLVCIPVLTAWVVLFLLMVERL
ncbi:auxin efflux carrier [Fimicolochytrium jonesii]|uniref:auxin efflux carrier n=1 Tax=Fimicolochytrium jonesii TaxID=1396493 RepID=UPI0022FE80BA|nr:auxin efflux carrier [Fimicolochytrium jonesii]KAI8817712.1 auxin efflux carrier [Fimicolochytrium jonesii]